MILTPKFNLREMARTNHRGLAEENWRLAHEHLDALHATAGLLQVVRDHFGAPVIVHSGYRCPALNSAIGGSPTSQHMRGEAADCHVHGVPLEEVWTWIWKKSGFPFGQLILEGVVAGEPSWVHLSLGEPWRSRTRSREVLTWDAAGGYRRVEQEASWTQSGRRSLPCWAPRNASTDAAFCGPSGVGSHVALLGRLDGSGWAILTFGLRAVCAAGESCPRILPSSSPSSGPPAVASRPRRSRSAGLGPARSVFWQTTARHPLPPAHR